jgi:hypothetical protein
MKMENDPYVKSISNMNCSELFEELLISRQRAKVVWAFNFIAESFDKTPLECLIMEILDKNRKLEKLEMNKTNKFKHQDDLYDLVNLKEPTRIK